MQKIYFTYFSGVKYFYETLSKCSSTTLYSHGGYIRKNASEPRLQELANPRVLFLFCDNLFLELRIKAITDLHESLIKKPILNYLLIENY